MEAGADDYLIKPFTARELVARVDAHLKISRFRREALEKELKLRQDWMKPAAWQQRRWKTSVTAFSCMTASGD